MTNFDFNSTLFRTNWRIHIHTHTSSLFQSLHSLDLFLLENMHLKMCSNINDIKEETVLEKV